MTTNKQYKQVSDFQTKDHAGYTDQGLMITPEKTKILAESLIRWEMTVNEDTIDASVKTAKTLLLHLGYDPTWVEDKFIPRFDRNLTKLNQNKPKPSRRNW